MVLLVYSRCEEEEEEGRGTRMDYHWLGTHDPIREGDIRQSDGKRGTEARETGAQESISRNRFRQPM
jgi:hypothetical protein